MDAEEAQFSLQYNVAAAILERKLDLEEFTEEKVSDPKRREFMRKVRLIVHPEWESVGLMGGTNPIVIKLKDGKQFSRDCVYAIGGPEERLPTAELSALFRPMARRVLSEKDVVRVEELVLDLENIGDLTELTGLLLG
jgi:2-methylcitrate dehydratase